MYLLLLMLKVVASSFFSNRVSELRVVELLDGLCENMLDYTLEEVHSAFPFLLKFLDIIYKCREKLWCYLLDNDLKVLRTDSTGHVITSMLTFFLFLSWQVDSRRQWIKVKNWDNLKTSMYPSFFCQIHI